MSNLTYTDVPIDLIVNKLSKEKYDSLVNANLINDTEIYLVDEDNLDAASGVISNVGTPVSPTDAANKSYVDTVSSNIVDAFPKIPDDIVTNNAGNNTTNLAIGNSAQTIGCHSIATGNDAQAIGSSSIATGYSAKVGTILNPNTEAIVVVGESAIALGKYAYAQDAYTIAIGASKDYDYSVSASTAVPIVIGSDYSTVSAAQITVTSAGILNVGGNPVAMQSEIPDNIVTNNADRSMSSIAIGYNAEVTGYYSIAIGCHARSTSDISIATGVGAQAKGESSIATGYLAQATTYSSIATGNDAQATGYASIAAGFNTQATGYNSIAIGCHAQANGDYSIATGTGAKATCSYSIATGSGAKATCSYSIATGSGAKAGTILNPNTETSAVVGKSAIALGYYAYAQDDYTIAIGASKSWSHSVSASTAVPIVIGSDVSSVSAAQITVTSAGILNVGGNPVAMQDDIPTIPDNIVINTASDTINNLAIGTGAQATSYLSIATGYYAQATSCGSISIGCSAQAVSKHTIAIGAFCHAASGDVSATANTPIVIGSNASEVSAAQIRVTNDGILKIGNNEMANKSYVDSMIGDINTILASI